MENLDNCLKSIVTIIGGCFSFSGFNIIVEAKYVKH